ncbi:heparin lyase I family protein [Nitrosospira sp. NpAV]|uniref:heparin lyase I family protein n=1 Tax=Nitrosospira sp. NpAV TaxID=58133 RepID=UPI00059F128F|nr:heparin lyase I family protein [Nitrosospira sp. NpAV]KIO48195.1 hypothetical protein SQ11_13650 [Nitrosospira sp. NpAV]
MALNPNVTRIASASDLNDTNKYVLKRWEPARISMVDDPVNQRGQVVRIVRNINDGIVSGSHRTEIVRDRFISEYAFKTGGGFYWGSYMLAPEWLEKHHLLEASVPKVTDYSINIQQFHPRNTDNTTHPKWTVAINEFGVCLRKWNQSDAAGDYEIVARWPVDALVWHDVVCQAVWSIEDGLFALYLDDRLMYRFVGPTIYPGATAGCWWAEGIYAPGNFPPGITELSTYVQGLKQAYPPGPYSLCRDRNAKYIRNIRSRSLTGRPTGARALATRTTVEI